MKNTGMEKAVELTVTKMVGSTIAVGYPRIYRLTDAFGDMSAKSESELAELYSSDYLIRLDAFKQYIESVEIGLMVDTSEAYRENLTTCPIPEEI